MQGFENQVGFNISSSKLQEVEVNFIGDQFRLVNVNEVNFDEEINFEQDSDLKITTVLQNSFNKLQSRKSLKSKFASFTLPFELFHVMQIPYDNSLLSNDLVDEFRWEFSVLYPFIPTKDLVIQYFEIEKNAFNQDSTALVFAIQRRYLEILNSFCNKNNLQLRFVDHLHIAAERSLSVSNAIFYKGLTLSVYLNKNFLSLLIAFSSKPLYFKVIPLNDVSEITDHLLKELSGSSLNKIDRSQIEAAFISGEEIPVSVVTTLKKVLGFDFITFNPFDKIRPIPELYESKFYLERFNSFSAAAGIAFRLA